MPTAVQAVTLADPYPYYARLVEERPFAFDESVGAWVASSAAAVTAVLSEPALAVRPPGEPVPAAIAGTAAGAVFGRLVRFTEGEFHERLRPIVLEALAGAGADPGRAGGIAAERTAAVLRRRDPARTDPDPDPDPDSAFGLREVMYGVPAQTVAALCGLSPDAGDEAGILIGRFVLCLSATATSQQTAAAARAAERLTELYGAALDTGSGLLGELVRAARRADWRDQAPLVANAVGLLSQTYDATAGLIGNTLLALARGDAPADRSAAAVERAVRETVRFDAPVHNTRRFAARPLRLFGETVEPGQSVLAVLAAANRDPAANPDPHAFRAERADPAVFTFGLGPHGCPGQALAVSIAAAAVGGLLSAGFDEAALSAAAVGYRTLPNIRIPLL